MGKTVTTEYAYFHPGKTRNPHDPSRTPGGSSSGSAAAVAAFMVPGALGTQTNGSVIRPAAFCGIVGFKPTLGLIPRSGELLLSRSLDQVGVFARSVEDVALLAESIVGFHEEDPDTRPTGRPPFAAVAASAPPLTPRFAFVKSPVWEQAELETRQAFASLVETLGGAATEVELPSGFNRVVDLHRVVMEVEMAHNLHRDYEKARDQLSDKLRQLIERGREHKAVAYAAAVAGVGPLNASLDELFNEYDAILTPSAPGPATVGIGSTGNPIFCTTWTYLGVPAVSLPLLQSGDGLPIGVQLVGHRGLDARLLRTARWLFNTVARGSGKKFRKAAIAPARKKEKS
jgi:Asp-tRNA(Asn)/Glu-tRNA(Gln) amidotransferase A subunit family amidase